jgi:hypothetical protein
MASNKRYRPYFESHSEENSSRYSSEYGCWIFPNQLPLEAF